MIAAETVADDVRAFFAEHEVASLRLPTGWFGRPHDNWHHLSEVGAQDNEVVIRLDEIQVLRISVEATASPGRILRLTIPGGRWDWTEYGGERRHAEVLGPGIVELHAPFDI